MNFKKYHVSKNLFPLDENKLHVGRIENDGTIDYEIGTLTVGTDSVTYEANTTWRGFYTDFIQVNENEQLTFSPNVSSSVSWACACYDENDNFLGKATAQATASIKTFTLLTGTKKVRISVTSSNATYTILRPMLNTGSTALPYEPYSSEVWHDTPHYIHNTSTDTITTLPADIYANDTTAMVGLKGQAVQSSVPSPTSPVMPQGCGNKTANLCNNVAYKTNYSINAQGVETAFPGFNIYTISCEANTTYTVSLSSFLSGTTVRIHTYNNSVWIEQTAYASIQSLPLTFTTPNNADEIRISITNTASNKIMLNSGSTTLPFEPFGVKIPILSNSTTTPVYLGEVQSVRRIRKIVLTGEEDWTQSGAASNTFYCSVTDYLRQKINITICSHYTSQVNINGAAEMQDGNVSFYANAAQPWKYFYVRDSNLATVADLKSYLAAQYAAGTPVCVWYVLATETTGIVNEPLMRIGDYADTLSNISIPVTAGGDTLSVGTTVQPSEVTVNYKGWHPVQSVHNKTAQMFDKDNADIYGGTSLSVADKWYYAGGQATVIRIPCEASTLYTLKINASNSVFRISTVATDDIPSEGNDVVATTIVNSDQITEYTFTTPSGAKYILFQGSYAVLSTILNTLMLNEGSTALPYEPYWT